MTAPPRPPLPGPLDAWRRPLRRGLALLAGVALAWVGAHAAMDRAGVRERVRERAGRVLAARVPSAVLGDEVSIDWLFRATLGPLVIPAGAQGAPPVVRVERLKIRLAWLALLGGRIEPASVRLLGVRVAPGPGGRELVDLAGRLRRGGAEPTAGPAAGRRGQDPVLHVRDLTVALPVGARTLELGPFDLRLERRRHGGAETLAATARLPGGGRADATLERTAAPRSAEGAAPPPAATGPAPAGGRAEGGDWNLVGHLEAGPADLPTALRGRAVAVTGGALAVELHGSWTSAGGQATVRGEVRGLELRGAPLGPAPVGPLHATGEATLEVAPAGRRLTLRRAVLRPAGPLAIEASGGLTAADDLSFELALRVAPVDYREVVAALPAALAPGADAPMPRGAVGGTLALGGPLRSPEAWTVQAEVDLAGLREAARRGPPSPLLAPFTAHPDGPDGPAVLLGPANPDFVPVAELPDHVVRAVTMSEDAGFFAHRGFDFDELRNAVVAGVRAGRLARGGSTISQQLAKNLFLSRDRTLARKAREALVTVALEGTVPKARLLELYLNVIEWGPGLHGIGPAAHHYLGKDARLLTPREACFLATLIPSPLRSHAALQAGTPVARWSERIDDLLRRLAGAGYLDEEALARALAEPLALAAWVPAQPGTAGPSGQPGEGQGPGEEEGDEATARAPADVPSGG